MKKLEITGGKRLTGTISVSGSKNVALKALVAACLTNEGVVIENIPLISDFMVMVKIIKELGGEVKIKEHSCWVKVEKFKKEKITLDEAAKIRASAMFVAPLIARLGKAVIPNPGGCRIGARPIDRTIKGLRVIKFILKIGNRSYLKKQKIINTLWEQNILKNGRLSNQKGYKVINIV